MADDTAPGTELGDDLDVFATANPLVPEALVEASREDANAVVCPDWNARARGLLVSPAEGSETRLMKMIPYGGIICFLGLALICYWFMEDVFHPTGQDAMRLVALFTMTPTMYAFTRVVPELFAVLLPAGELAALGIGRTKISTSALVGLESQRKHTRLVQGISAIGALLILAVYIFFFSFILYLRAGFTRRILDFVIVAPLALGTIWILAVTIPLACEFALTLQVAAALVSDEVLEIVRALNSVSPADTVVWEAKVVRPSLALANGAIYLLSRGWGRGLALLYVGFWSPAIGVLYTFSYQLELIIAYPNGSRVIFLLIMMVLLLLLLGLPLAMSTAVAQVSTSCDDLGNAINQCRIQDLGHSERLLALELALQNLNNRQGLGL
jgi:hypothetical protein